MQRAVKDDQYEMQISFNRKKHGHIINPMTQLKILLIGYCAPYARKICPSLIMTGCKIYQMSVKVDERFAKLIFRGIITLGYFLFKMFRFLTYNASTIG